MNIPSLKDTDLKDKRVFVRLDFDYLFEKNFKTGRKQIYHLVSPTVDYLLKEGAKVIIAPSFQKSSNKKGEYSVEPYARYICDLYRCNVYLTEQAVGDVAVKLSQDMEPASILFLENLFNYEEELSGEKEFAEKLSKLFELYVYEAITLSDRQLASNFTVLDIVEKENIFSGFNFESEYLNIKKILSDTSPVTICIESEDILAAINVAENLIERTDKILLLGEISNLYTCILNKSVNNKYSKNMVNKMKKLIESAEVRDIEIINMVDYYVSDDMDNTLLIKNEPFKAGNSYLDIGDETGDILSEALSGSELLLWIGKNMRCKESELVFGSAKIFDKINKNNIYSIAIDTNPDRFNSKSQNEDGFLNYYSSCYNTFIKIISNEQMPVIEKLESKFK